MTIALDVGHRLVKLAVVEGSSKAPKIMLYAQKRVPYSDDPDRYERNRIDTVQAMLEEHGLRGKPALINIDASHCSIRLITVNLTQKEQIDKTILYTIEGYLPGIGIDDVVVDYHVVETMDNGSKILTIAVPKKHLRQTLQLYEEAGLDIPGIGLDCFSLFNTLSATGYTEAEEANLFLDLGADDMKIMLVDHGTLKLVRSAKAGTFSGTRVMAKTRRLTPDQVEDIAANSDGTVIQDGNNNGLEPGDLREWQQQYLNKVVAEVTRTSLRISLSTPINKIYLTGGGSRFPGACEFFREKLGMDVELLDLSSRLTVESTQEQPASFNAHAAVVIGTAMKGIGMDVHETDFRQDEFRYERRFQQIQKSLVLVCALLLCLFGLVAFTLNQRLNHLNTVHQSVEDKEKEVWLATFTEGHEQDFPGFGKVKPRMGSMKMKLEEQVGEIQGQDQKTSALVMLYEFLALTQTETLRDNHRVISMWWGQKDSKLMLEVKDSPTATRIQQALRNSEIILASPPRVESNMDSNRNPYWKATMDISLRGKE